MIGFECIVENVEPLRYMGMHRVQCKCDEAEITIELHEKIMVVKPRDKLFISISSDEKECMKNDFCGQGYVVSMSKIEDHYRVVISISGILVVLKQKTQPKSLLKVTNKVYVGVSKK